ncbi:carbohydrate porin [Flavobacterium sp. 123]|uniref:carbohydrate porin n=1 Tax=Flavobacterium sp. 123 TaxID=2135627 RepID=UPI000EB44D51|nr:carbohydrate porin [Flavobacterium sp. 123]RKS98362.1 high affinity Mn2+ porin [Flavobacterium sp. 123]
MKKLPFLFLFMSVFFSTKTISQTTDSIQKYSLKFQMTSVYQWHPEFKADYSGTNSMLSKEQRALSLTSTLFLDVPLWKGGLFTFNPEMSGGEGLSSAKGLGGFPNGETFRIGEAKPVVYMARMLLQQKFKFKNNQSLQIVAGKFGLADYFDGNTYSHDPRTQFLNWSLMTHGAWDYAANTRGYTDGIYANYQFDTWQVRASLSALPTNANGPNLGFSFKKSNAVNLEVEKKITFKNNDSGTIKLLGYKNLAGMGNYNLANSNYIITPNIVSTRQDGRTKYGIGINADYSHSDTWGLFGRMSYNDGKNETWAFTEIDQSASLGINLKGKIWNRSDDFAGLAIATNGLSASHQTYQKLGGNGFMIGDGNLNYGTEKIVEAFYSFAIPHTSFTLSPDYQFVVNPGYNKDRGPIQFVALRFHAQF